MADAGQVLRTDLKGDPVNYQNRFSRFTDSKRAGVDQLTKANIHLSKYSGYTF